MSIRIIDYLLDELLVENLPHLQPLVIVCKETCTLSPSLTSRFSISSDLERISSGSSEFVIRVSGELQRGLVYSILTKPQRTSIIYTSRPEVISKYLPSCKFEPLRTPLRTSILPPPPFSNKPAAKKLTNPFDIIYKESLDKYVETFLMNTLRASRAKSARAQLKNLIDGLMTSFKKQQSGQFDFTFTSEEITEAILGDLEGHGIISTSGLHIDYHDDWIEVYFGKGKSKAFIPGQRTNPPPSQRAEENSKKDQEVLNCAEKLTEICLDDPRIPKCTTVSDLSLLCKMTFKDYKLQNSLQLSLKQDEAILKIVYKAILTQCFRLGSKADEIAEAPQEYFEFRL